MSRDGIIATSLDHLPITVGERYDSAEHNNSDTPQIIRKYRVLGTWLEDIAYQKMCAYLGERFKVVNNRPCDSGLPVMDIRQNPIAGIPGYEFEITFSRPDYQEPEKVEIEDYSYKLSAGSKTSRVTHSLETISATTLDGSEPQDFGGGIGLNDSGGFDGVDLTTPAPQLTIEVSLPRTFYTRAYRIMLSTMIGAVNSDYFDGYAPGEVMLNRVEPSIVVFRNPVLDYQKDFYWRASYNFIISPNIIIPFGEQNIPKLGWDYAWRVTEKYEDSKTKKTNVRTRQLNVERVYRYIPFSALMLPTPK